MRELRPGTAPDLCDILTDARSRGIAFEIRSGGSKSEIGHPDREVTLLNLGGLAGVRDYEPSELVLTAGPATPLNEVEALLATSGQMLAFEPWDHGPLFEKPPGEATLGGVICAGVAGSRRLSAGGARDHLLGFSGVSGRGEAFKAGGKVVKNVTGYDVSKLIAGSWGQFALVTELSIKVMPRPHATATLALAGLGAERAVAAMARAVGSPCTIAAAAHVPAGHEGGPLTLLRLEGFRPSVEARLVHASELLADFGATTVLDEQAATALWASLAAGVPVASAATVWRVHLVPSQAAAFADRVERLGAQWYLDWAGALAWAGAPEETDVRAVAEGCGGHAMLLRAPEAVRRLVPARHPEAAGVAALTARLKQVFDPAGVLDPLRLT